MFGKNVSESNGSAITIDGHMGSLSFDGQILTITKKMKGGTTRIPVNQIGVIEFVPAGLLWKAVRFGAVGGGQDHKRKLNSDLKDWSKDPQALPFGRNRLSEFEAFVTQIQDAIGSPVVQSAPVADLSAQLVNLGELHRSGVLSDDEFASAKLKLIS